MGTETHYEIEETTWNDEVVADFDERIAAIEDDIAKTKAELHRLSEGEDQDDILLM